MPRFIDSGLEAGTFSSRELDRICLLCGAAYIFHFSGMCPKEMRLRAITIEQYEHNYIKHLQTFMEIKSGDMKYG